MAVGDFDCPALISEAVITGCWPALTTIINGAGFCHAINDIYCLGFGEDSATDRNLFLATIRVTGTGTITAAALDFYDFSLCDPSDPRVELHQLSDGIVAAFFSVNTNDGCSLTTFSIHPTTGAITVVDGPDQLRSDLVRIPGPRANKVSPGVWGLMLPDTFVGEEFLTFSLTDAGVIGSILDGPDTGVASPDSFAWIYFDQNVAIHALNVSGGAGNARAETFTLNETTGIFNIATQLDEETAITSPKGPVWFGHVDPRNPSLREVFLLGDAVVGGGGVPGLAHLSVDACDNITLDDAVAVSAGVGSDLSYGLVIGDRKVFFMGGGTSDDAFVFVADACGNLTEHASELALGFCDCTMVIRSSRPIYLTGSSNGKIVVGFVDAANELPMVAVIGVKVAVEEAVADTANARKLVGAGII